MSCRVEFISKIKAIPEHNSQIASALSIFFAAGLTLRMNCWSVFTVYDSDTNIFSAPETNLRLVNCLLFSIDAISLLRMLLLLNPAPAFFISVQHLNTTNIRSLLFVLETNKTKSRFALTKLRRIYLNNSP